MQKANMLADFPALKNIWRASHYLVGFVGVKTVSAKCHINAESTCRRKIR